MNTILRSSVMFAIVAGIAGEVHAADLWTEASQLVEFVRLIGLGSTMRLDEISETETGHETVQSLNARLASARRLGALLYFPAIPALERRAYLSEGIFDQSNFPCQDVLNHFGRAAVVPLARSVALSPHFTADMYLYRSSCLDDAATHLEGLIIEAREPIRRNEMNRFLRHLRESLTARKTQRISIHSYPSPLPMPPEEFESGLLPDFARLPARLHRVGGELIDILKDSGRVNSDRVRAAALLGQLKYVMAISVLVDHLSLVDPTGTESPKNVNDIPMYPCAVAVAAFRSGASVDLAHLIADAPTADKVREWKRLILDEDALRGVITHLRGMAVEATDETRRSLLHSYIRILRADEDNPEPSPPLSIAWFLIPVAVIAGYAACRIRHRPPTAPVTGGNGGKPFIDPNNAGGISGLQGMLPP